MLVKHIELLRCVFAGILHDHALATRVLVHKCADGKNLAVDDDPTILLSVVASNLDNVKQITDCQPNRRRACARSKTFNSPLLR